MARHLAASLLLLGAAVSPCRAQLAPPCSAMSDLQQSSLDAVTRTCCAWDQRWCASGGGLPRTCTAACAASFMPLYTACTAELAAMRGFTEFAATCPAGWQASVSGGDAAPSPGSFADRARAAIVGAFVADAASMPFHWVYSQSQIQRTVMSVGRDSTPEFYPTPQVRFSLSLSLSLSLSFSHAHTHCLSL
eukprot:COSAG03_NODE_3245_length_2125_cov_6.171273_2_plen_191_part_00